MANLNKDGWTGPNQVTFSSASDQAVQYREKGFGIIDDMRSVGWTSGRSSNGTNAGAGTDFATGRIEDADDIVFGTEASQAHSWVEMIPPSGKGNPAMGTAFRVFLNFNNSNADTTPQNVDIYLAVGSYSGGSTTTRATITGVELSVLAHNMIPWTAALAGSMCSWTTEDGDVYFASKANGDSFFRSLMWIRDDPENALGEFTLTLFAISNATADIVTAASLQTTSAHRAFLSDGSGAVSATSGQCIAFALSALTSGQEATTSRVPMRDVELWNNAAAAAGRDFGALVDVRGCPANTGWNHEDVDATVDNSNQWPMIHRTIGDLAMPGDAAIT
jgi:hypothetical protein